MATLIFQQAGQQTRHGFWPGYNKNTLIGEKLREKAMRCACCGGDMLPDKDIGNSVLYRCKDCGISDTRVKSEEMKGQAC